MACSETACLYYTLLVNRYESYYNLSSCITAVGDNKAVRSDYLNHRTMAGVGNLRP
jgi:hypothetical protein